MSYGMDDDDDDDDDDDGSRGESSQWHIYIYV